MDIRAEMLKAAEALLVESAERDVSTRAVFGDKNGLLAAVVDRTFERYLTSKRAQQLSDDPVDDLCSAWDLHIAFALKNQTVYRMAYAPSLYEVPAGVEQARQLLLGRLVRCAEAGRLTTSPDEAAQIMMAAATGVAIGLISQPAIFRCPRLSQRVRDAVLQELLVETVPADRRSDTPNSVALQMAALLRANPTPLSHPEAALMLQWLESITAAAAADTAKPTRATNKPQKSSRGRPRR
jgi:AcrR family transcriptional regulator